MGATETDGTCVPDKMPWEVCSAADDRYVIRGAGF